MNGYIKNVWFNSPNVLSEERIREIYKKLSLLTNKDVAYKKEHVTNINSKLNSTEICPWCRNKLVIRTVKTGANAGKQFYGCSNYPKCKFSKNI